MKGYVSLAPPRSKEGDKCQYEDGRMVCVLKARTRETISTFLGWSMFLFVMAASSFGGAYALKEGLPGVTPEVEYAEVSTEESPFYGWLILLGGLFLSAGLDGLGKSFLKHLIYLEAEEG